MISLKLFRCLTKKLNLCALCNFLPKKRTETSAPVPNILHHFSRIESANVRISSFVADM